MVPARTEVMGNARDGIRVPSRCCSRSAVPDGASSLAAWCSSSIEATNSGARGNSRASSRAARRKSCTPDREVGRVEQRPLPRPPPVAVIRGSASFQPVVPVTVGIPELDQPLQVGDHGIGPGELDRHVDPRQPLGGQGSTTGVVRPSHHGVDGVAALPRQRRHRFSHLRRCRRWRCALWSSSRGFFNMTRKTPDAAGAPHRARPLPARRTSC